MMDGHVYTIYEIGLVNGLINFLGHHKKSTLNECVANISKTAKSGDAVKHPLVRVRQLAQFARDLGLLVIDGDVLSLTPL